MEKLAVIIPVYNEGEVVSKVLDDWRAVLKEKKVDFTIHVYNDGSTDNTAEVLARMESERIVVHNNPNAGHGPTILRGYRENTDCTWIFQVDSDDEMSAAHFASLWEKRDQFDFLIGRRGNRIQNFPRRLMSFISRLTVHCCYHSRKIWDVNSPYRLMRVALFKNIFHSIPENTFAPNLVISGMACLRNHRTFEVRLNHTARKTGVCSLNVKKMLGVSFLSLVQTIGCRVRLARVVH